MEWIYFVIIFFYILSALSKAAKKKQLEAQKIAAAKPVKRRVEAPPAAAVAQRPSRLETAAEAFTDLPVGDVMRFINEKMNERKVGTVDYDLIEHYDQPKAEAQAEIEREHTPASHFHMAKGIRTSLHDRSSMATAPQFAAPTFMFTRKADKPVLTIERADLKKYFIMSEILGKPRSMRKR